jgi:hypothetical protein
VASLLSLKPLSLFFQLYFGQTKALASFRQPGLAKYGTIDQRFTTATWLVGVKSTHEPSPPERRCNVFCPRSALVLFFSVDYTLIRSGFLRRHRYATSIRPELSLLICSHPAYFSSQRDHPAPTGQVTLPLVLYTRSSVERSYRNRAGKTHWEWPEPHLYSSRTWPHCLQIFTWINEYKNSPGRDNLPGLFSHSLRWIVHHIHCIIKKINPP